MKKRLEEAMEETVGLWEEGMQDIAQGAANDIEKKGDEVLKEAK